MHALLRNKFQSRRTQKMKNGGAGVQVAPKMFKSPWKMGKSPVMLPQLKCFDLCRYFFRVAAMPRKSPELLGMGSKMCGSRNTYAVAKGAVRIGT